MTVRLVFFLSALLTLAIIHIAATEFYLYWKYLWLDIPMHFLGGVCVALGLLSLNFFRIQLPLSFRSFKGCILLVLAVGVLWEIFELIAGISIFDEYFIPDTLVDLIMDAVGGMLGYVIARSTEAM